LSPSREREGSTQLLPLSEDCPNNALIQRDCRRYGAARRVAITALAAREAFFATLRKQP
jgi:hypothetical protein